MIPDSATLERAFRRAEFAKAVRGNSHELIERAKEHAQRAKPLEDLGRKVQAWLARHPAASWDIAVSAIAEFDGDDPALSTS